MYTSWLENKSPGESAKMNNADQLRTVFPDGFIGQSSGIIAAKRILNMLHRWLSENYYSEV